MRLRTARCAGRTGARSRSSARAFLTYAIPSPAKPRSAGDGIVLCPGAATVAEFPEMFVGGCRSFEISRGPCLAAQGDDDTLRGVTDREPQTLTLIGRRRSNAETCATMGIRASTVKSSVTRLLSKLGARDRVQLVITAYENGLVSPRGES